MKKEQLVKEVAKKTKMKTSLVKLVTDSIFEEISHQLENKEPVEIWNFGTFGTRKYDARKCYNPISAKVEVLSPSTVPVFKAGKKLRSRVNN